MPIKTIRHDTQLTEHVASGRLTDHDLALCVEKFYANPTQLVLWDVRLADPTKVSTEAMRGLIEHSAELGKVRPDGRTAVLLRTSYQTGMGIIAENYAGQVATPFKFRIFMDRDAALEWLRADPEQD